MSPTNINLAVVDICRLLDEDGIFGENGELNVDELQLRANQLYRQDKKREGERQRTLSRTQVISNEEPVDSRS